MTQAASIPVIVAAKNEAGAIEGAIEALLASCRYAEAASDFRYSLRVVLDDTTDGSAEIVLRYPCVELRRSCGGKVEAQRVGFREQGGNPEAPFAIFCDADVRPSEDAVLALSVLIESNLEVQVATCRMKPLRPRRRTLLAEALHTYNLRRGFSSQRAWFNGKLFAIRAWNIPERAALVPRIACAPADRFYDFDSGLVIDDIYLSRAVVSEYGAQAIAEAAYGTVFFRAPETLRGMNRYYQRMRRELERVDALFPELSVVHRSDQPRRPDLLHEASFREKMHYAYFSAALALCKVHYLVNRSWVRRVRYAGRPGWPPIEETKVW